MRGRCLVSDGGLGTQRGGNSEAVTEYALRVTHHSNVFVTLASVGFYYSNVFQNEKLKGKLERKAGKQSREIFGAKVGDCRAKF